MAYRDDVDTLYTRAMLLQRELDAAQEKLAEREAELASLRGESFSREHTSPGLRALRELPPAETLLERLVASLSGAERTSPEPAPSSPPPVPEPYTPPAWLQGVDREAAVLRTTRERLGDLDTPILVLVGAIVEQLVKEPERATWLVAELRRLVAEISVERRR